MSREQRLTQDVQALRRGIDGFFRTTDGQGRRVCSAACGIYAFYDYDGEPIYVGQTYERLSGRIGRHLTNQRTDAVAMHVLDPMEVASIEVWPFWGLENSPNDEKLSTLNRAEYSVFVRLSDQAKVSKLLNEAAPTPTESIELPESYRGDIVVGDLRTRLGHPDERIARRAATIANLAQVVRERDVSLGLRQTLLTQAQRLELLSRKRLEEVAGQETPEEQAEETLRAGPEE